MQDERGEPIEQVLCPMSGLLVQGKEIQPHKIGVYLCKNGTLTAFCTYHCTRVFVTQPFAHELRHQKETQDAAQKAG